MNTKALSVVLCESFVNLCGIKKLKESPAAFVLDLLP